MDLSFLKSLCCDPIIFYYIYKMYHIWYCIWGNAWIVDMENMSNFDLIL